jgi:short-subunit dehydrogenase
VAPIEHTEFEDFRDSLDTHFWGPLYLIRECVPAMMRRGWGYVINISSIGGRIGVPHLGAYSAGKFALTGFSEVLHAELARYGVVVTTVTPHLMRTGSHRNAIVRGQHAKEALWFALASSAPRATLDADDAARQVIDAARERRAVAIPGWQARVADVIHAAAPDAAAAFAAWVASFLLPGASRGDNGHDQRLSREIDLHFLAKAFPTNAAERFNQTIAEDERRWSADSLRRDRGLAGGEPQSAGPARDR